MWGGRRFVETCLLTAALVCFVPTGQPGPMSLEPTLAAVRIFYAPATDLETVDRQLIDSARQSIDMAAYVLTNRAIISALSQAAARGVKLRLYLDPDQAMRSGQNNNGLFALLEARNVEARFKARSTDMHLKAFQVDGRVLRSGSANFSFTGAKHQDNDLILIESREAAGNFRAAFERLWARRDNETFQPLPTGMIR